MQAERAGPGGGGMKFRKKPVVIEAVRCSDVLYMAKVSWSNMPSWINVAYENGDILFLPDEVNIATLEGIRVALRGDWIIQGVKGELYPCKPDIFEATYEAVHEE